MGKINLQDILGKLIRLINLVAFDVASVEESKVVETVNPLVQELHISLHGPIHKDLHTPLRNGIKTTVKADNMLAGKISFGRSSMVIVIYLKGLRRPAWSHQDAEKRQETSST